MGYSEYLADRIHRLLQEQHVVFEERKMFGGLCFMVDGKMCVGINDSKLMARIGTEVYEDALKKEGVVKMQFTGRPLKGYVYVLDEAIDNEEQLMYWIQLCLDFNPKAKSSKKKK